MDVSQRVFLQDGLPDLMQAFEAGGISNVDVHNLTSWELNTLHNAIVHKNLQEDEMTALRDNQARIKTENGVLTEDGYEVTGPYEEFLDLTTKYGFEKLETEVATAMLSQGEPPELDVAGEIFVLGKSRTISARVVGLAALWRGWKGDPEESSTGLSVSGGSFDTASMAGIFSAMQMVEKHVGVACRMILEVIVNDSNQSPPLPIDYHDRHPPILREQYCIVARWITEQSFKRLVESRLRHQLDIIKALSPD